MAKGNPIDGRGAFAAWVTSFGAEQALRVPLMERALPGDRLSVGVTHSEGACTVRTVFHQKQNAPHAQPREECVTLFAGRRLFAEGEAFPVAVPGGSQLCRWAHAQSVGRSSECLTPTRRVTSGGTCTSQAL